MKIYGTVREPCFLWFSRKVFCKRTISQKSVLFSKLPHIGLCYWIWAAVYFHLQVTSTDLLQTHCHIYLLRLLINSIIFLLPSSVVKSLEIDMWVDFGQLDKIVGIVFASINIYILVSLLDRLKKPILQAFNHWDERNVMVV